MNTMVSLMASFMFDFFEDFEDLLDSLESVGNRFGRGNFSFVSFDFSVDFMNDKESICTIRHSVNGEQFHFSIVYYKSVSFAELIVFCFNEVLANFMGDESETMLTDATLFWLSEYEEVPCSVMFVRQ